MPKKAEPTQFSPAEIAKALRRLLTLADNTQPWLRMRYLPDYGKDQAAITWYLDALERLDG